MVFEEKDSDSGVIPTGCGQIDRKLGGGIPKASLVLIEGRFNSGKSALSQQVVWGALQENHRVALYSSEYSVQRLLQQMDGMGFQALDFFISAKLDIYAVPSSSWHRPGPSLKTLLAHMGELPQRDVFVVDSLTPFFTGVSVEEVLSFFTSCLAYCQRGKTLIFTVHSHVFSQAAFRRIRSICNVYLRLDVAEMGNRLVNMLEIVMLHDAERTRGNVVSFVVEPGVGIKILPFTRAKAA